MDVNQLPDTVYHGTVSIHRDSLLSGIDINKGYKSVDFGQGFYTTSDLSQAKKIAYDRTNAYNKKHKPTKPAYPIVIEYKIDKTILLPLKGKLFDSPSEKWIEFIYNNRVGTDYVINSYYNLDRRYHYVYGCVADSNIADIISGVKRGEITYGYFYDHIKPLQSSKYNQLSFHSELSIQALSFLRVIEFESEVLIHE